jgi:dGTP triphosphohydrolase
MGNIRITYSSGIYPDIPATENEVHDIGSPYQTPYGHTGYEKEK